jgi:cell division protein FtsN
MGKAPRPTLRWFDKLLLLAAWLVTSGVVYVLGYYVGKGTPARQAAVEERTVRLPVTSTPPAEGTRPKENKEFPSFYQALPAGERPIDVARGTPVTAPPATATATTVARTTTTAARPTTVPTTVPTPTTMRTPTTTVPRPAPTTTVPRPAPTPTTLMRSATPTTLPRPVGPPATTAPPPVVPRSAGRGGYTVEASPTRSRSEAEALLATLRRRGYDASLVQVERDGDTWYRLRVGRYASSEQATDTMRKLRDVEGVTHVFVATD